MSFSASKEELIEASMKAIKDRATAVGSPLSDEDAQALSGLMAGGDVTTITEEKYNAVMAQIQVATKEQLEMMLGMAKMMAAASQAQVE
jgi:hypothetical protein